MKIVLLQDIKGTGKKGDLVEMSDGYARNFILPRKLGKVADNIAINDIKNKKSAELHHREEELNAAKEIAKKLTDNSVTIKVKGGKDGKLFGSVTSKEVAHEIKNVCNIDINKKKISMNSDIKSFGTFTAHIKIHPEVSADINVIVSELV